MIVTFYSYKGGVGRSMALANVGTWLYQKGRRVLLVDWDLEAPGLESFFFHDERSLTEMRSRPGLVDLIETYRQLWNSSPSDKEEVSDPTKRAMSLTQKMGSIQHLMVPLGNTKTEAISTRNPGLWLLSAGCRAGDSERYYTKTVNAMDWGRFYEDFGGFVFLEWLRQQFEKDVEIVLIDSRTGITEMGGVCTQHLADIVMLLCAPNYSNLHGIRSITEILLSEPLRKLRGSGRPIRVFPIPARVDTQGTTNKLQDLERQFKQQFGTFEQIDTDWCWESKIRYVTNYSYEEEVLFTSDSAHPDILRTYERIGHQIAVIHDEAVLLPGPGIAGRAKGAREGTQRGDIEALRRTILELTTAAKEKIDKGDLSMAEMLVRSGLTLAEQDLGDEHPDTLSVRNLLATVLNYAGKYRESKTLWEQLADLYGRVHGQMDPLTLTSLSNLGTTLQKIGDFHKAQKVFEQVLTSRETVLGKDHPDTLIMMRTLSEALSAQGDLERARTLQERVLDASRRVLGDDHPDTLTSMSNLSETLSAQGDLERARTLQERVLKARIRILGEEHPDTMLSKSNVASILRVQGQPSVVASLKTAVREFRTSSTPSIYLSSTYEDLKECREAVYRTLRRSGYDVVAMEDYVAADERPVHKCLSDVEKADIYVGIFGFRYGYVPPHSNSNKLSITELEFRHAESLGKPCLFFLLDESTPWPPSFLDAVRQTDEGERIAALRRTLVTDKLVTFFSSPHELAALVLAGVTKALEYDKPGVQEAAKIEWPDGKSPYPGLLSFGREYAELFFGRDREVNSLIAKMTEPQCRFLFISGASGIGKSSLVQAGLWRELISRGRLPRSQNWEWLRIYPGVGERSPFEALARGLSQTSMRINQPGKLAAELAAKPGRLAELLAPAFAGDKELVLFIDQLEELFTGNFQQKDIGKFLEQLVTCASDKRNHLRVLATVRSQFISRLAETESILLLLNSGCIYHLGPVSPRVLEDMIEKPARATGYEFEAGLVDDLLTEVAQEPGALPLLAYALNQLFERRKGRVFTREAYKTMGGVVAAIGKVADEFIEGLDKEAASAFDKVFAEVVHIERDRPPTRKRGNVAALMADDGAKKLIDALAGEGCRILVISGEAREPSVEVAHDRLLTGWPKLNEWIDKAGDSLRLIDHAAEAAHRWQRRGEKAEELWPASGAEEVLSALRRFGKKATPVLNRFLQPPVLIERLRKDPLSHEERFRIGIKLAEFGDPRPGVGLGPEGLPDIAWVEIPAGKVKLEGVESILEVTRFRIAKYLVTNAQFEAFINAADGYQNEDWWKGIKQSEGPASPNWTEPNSPRETVSWFEAVAFCGWLSKRTGLGIRLPTEWEWQLAATGGNPEREYPWPGNWDASRCNSFESRLNRTTAVGMYPSGATVNGVFDMAGNVWEWCLNKYEEPANPDSLRIDDDENGRRVIRGGSWGDTPEFLRASFRLWNFADFRNDNIGFRLAQDIH